jgi:hypothetical protein
MPALTRYSDVSELIHDFEAQCLPMSRWTHEAHLAAGLWYVWHLGHKAALSELRVRICKHNESVGTANTNSSGYHESITRLYLLGIADQIADHAADESHRSFESALTKIMSSPLISSTWPCSFYSKDRLFSVEARSQWCEPDLQPPPTPVT